jgi:uncharacterized protein YndB with AHSA1/START domain
MTAIRHETTVPVNAEKAFSLFADHIGDWWPSENTFARVEGVQESLVGITIDRQPGGQWFERLADGRTLSWGRVLEYIRPERLTLTWQIGADGHPEPDPDRASVVEVHFTGAGETTGVTIVHRDFDRHGPEAGEIWRQAMGSVEGWPKFLAAFQAFAERA